MFKTNTGHLQQSCLDTVAYLSAARRERLENSWAGTFYQEVFCRLDETGFAALYSDMPSRPNTAINLLLGLEILKSGYGWSDEELFEHLDFDVQVRYALGVRDLETEICTLRTVYNFRRRVSAHVQATGADLFAQAFAQVTDAQCADLGLATRRQRMDSTQISSNIRQYSRLRLVVEVLQRAARMLTPADQEHYAEHLRPYVQSNAGQYCYRIPSGAYAQHLEQIGPVIAQFLVTWEPTYAEHAAYQLLQRVFHEHFSVAESSPPTEVTVKPPAALSANSLQAPDDPDATYRQKNGQGYRGYVANVTETCAPENPLQLITQIQVAPNTTDDQTLLAEAVPEIQERMSLTDLDVDGGYNGPVATQVTTTHAVTLHPTAIRGAQPDPDAVTWAAFTWEYSADALAQVTCPQQHTVPLTPGRADQRYLADFDAATCATCPLRERCPTRPLQRRPARVARVSQRNIEVAQLRRRCAATQMGPPFLRPAVEATVRSLKHPFGDERAQLPVRGQARVTMTMIASGFMVNLRRIWRYRQAQPAPAEENTRLEHQSAAPASFLSQCRIALRYLGLLPWRSANRCGGMCLC